MNVREIQELIIKALFSDDTLMEIFVLKGGAALDIVHKIINRTSVDIDVSLADDDADVELLRNRLANALRTTLREQGLEYFDYSFERRPKSERTVNETRWGGFQAEFKIIEKTMYDMLQGQPEQLRRRSFEIDTFHHKKFKIDFSCYEYCENPETAYIDGIQIKVYGLLVSMYEKLRAICQQHPSYVRKHGLAKQKPRAKDFYDITTIEEYIKGTHNIYSEENLSILTAIFEKKGVDLSLLKEIRSKDVKLFHELSFAEVEGAVYDKAELREFGYYHDRVSSVAEKAYKEIVRLGLGDNKHAN